MGYSIDGINKVITLTAGTTTVSVKDLWSRWVDWLLTSDNSKFLPAMKNVGGEDIDLSSGTSVPIYTFLINGWRIRPQESNHTLKITNGILVVDGGGDPFIDTLGDFVVRINYSQPVQAITITSGSGVTPQDKTDIVNGVLDELVSSHATAGTVGKIVQDLDAITKQIKALTAAQL